MGEAGLDSGAITYDGDTPGDARRAARERAAVLLTNPDMLHAGILPHHANWARVFSNLRFVVIDELHTYRGVFGSHLANVLRRLLRVAAFHGSQPVVLFASATIGNPQEHASRMLGREVVQVGESGAPAGPRSVLVYNPPVVNSELGIRQSYLKATVRLTADLVRAQVPTLVFGQGRNQVETMLKYLRDKLAPYKIEPDQIMSYRGGYLPETRRRIEAGLRAGEIRCVVATNALELGIDIGCLDAVVCAGYPGSVAALWQRFGRAGRRREGSLAVLVASSAPLDQYCARDPEAIVGAPVEQARIDPDNVEILVQHLKCAAFELPFEEGESFGSVTADDTTEALDFLAKHELLHPVPGREGRRVYHWAADAYPANHVSLRSVGWDNFVVIERDNNHTIAEMDFRSTHTMLHEQAIYQHEGEQYQVEKLDFENHKAFVRKVEPDYFTTALTYRTVSVIEPRDGGRIGHAIAGFGDVKVIEKVTGYKKIKFFTHENAGYGDVHLPEMQMHTTSFWLTVPEAILAQLPHPRATLIDGLRGLGAALETVSALFLMCDPRDIGQTLGDGGQEGGDDVPAVPPGRDPHAGRTGQFEPTVFLFDALPGGVGLAERIYERGRELCWAAGRLIRSCGCPAGCPACVGPSSDGSPRKGVALELLAALGLTARDVKVRGSAILAS
jgi:DEAD/DEAH box helicase domain-containing protein